MQVFASTHFAVISRLMVKAHLLLCSWWCWMEPGGVRNEQTTQFVGTLKMKYDQIISNSSWWVGLCAFLWWFRRNLIGFEGSGSGATWLQNKHCINIDQCTDGWISSIIKTRYSFTMCPKRNPSQMYSWRLVVCYNSLVIMSWRDVCWTGNGTSFQNVYINVYCIWYNVGIMNSYVEWTAT